MCIWKMLGVLNAYSDGPKTMFAFLSSVLILSLRRDLYLKLLNGQRLVDLNSVSGELNDL